MLAVLETVGVAAVIALAVLMMIAAIAKVFALAEFRATLDELGASSAATRFVAPIIIGLEWLLGGGLMLAPHSKIAVGAVATAFLCFAVVGAYVMVSRRAVGCSCFGSLSSATWDGRS